MTLRQASALAVVFAGAMALGVWSGPYITGDRSFQEPGTEMVRTEAKKPEADAVATARPAGVARPRPVEPVAVVALSEPDLHARLRPVLNRGTDLRVASAEFKDAIQFAAVAHAARNTGIPFMVLKHRVVNEGMSLEKAIDELSPEKNARLEADLAIAQARFDVHGTATQSLTFRGP